jgi:hypothetical protein
MIEKLVYVESREELQNHTQKFGGYNDSLPNLEEITSEQFAQSCFFVYSVTSHETRQVLEDRINKEKLLLPVKGYLSLRIFYTNSPHHSGYAIANDYYDKQIRYFKFTECNHEWISQPAPFNNYHVNKCTKCNKVWEYDTSG